MRAILLGFLVALGTLVLPVGAAAQPVPQQGADDYGTRLMLWQQLAERELDAATLIVADNTRWDDSRLRDDEADRLGLVIQIARRPPRDYAEVYRLRVQPVNDWLDGLATALRLGRREEAQDALGALRPYLGDTRGAPAGPVQAAGDLQAPPSSIEAYLNAAIQRAGSSCTTQASELGWSPDMGVAANQYLRDFWAQWLEAAHASPAERAGVTADDCAGLLAEAQRVALDRGFEQAERQGWIEPAVNRLQPGTATGLALRQYREMVSRLKRVLPDSMQCYFRLARAQQTPPTGRFSPGLACESFFDDVPACLATGATPTGQLSLPALLRCISGSWDTAYTQVQGWTPPAEYRDFHLRLLASLTALSLARDYTSSAFPATSGQAGGGQAAQPTAGQVADSLRNAQSLVQAGEQQCRQAFLLYDGTTCGVEDE